MQDPLGGVLRSETIDGVSVETIAEVIGPNSAYYLPRFLSMSRSGKKVSWNTAAFLFTAKWLLYRKNLLIGWLSFAFELVLYFFTLYVNSGLLQLGTPSALVNTSSGMLLSTMMLIISAASLVICLMLGLFGNWLYMQQVLKKARKLQENPDLQYNQSFVATGGISPAMAVLPFVIQLFLEYLIMFLL